MADQLANISSPEELAAEIARLRNEIARLESKVQQLDQLAHLDPLIGLPNRRGFMRRLEALIARVQRYGDHGAMLFVDIDGLKSINDQHGHQAGDEALIRVSQMLVSGVRSGDCVARLGGDEFGIILEHADEAIATETAARLIQHIAACDFAHEGAVLPLGVAIGVGMIGSDDNAEAIMDRADEA
ncbi:MAG: GGDEF domain-containing protein, partial [Sphingomicrobium sp.]